MNGKSEKQERDERNEDALKQPQPTKKKWRVNWRRTEYGVSYVEAEDMAQACILADEGKDHGFEELGDRSEWETHDAEEVDDDDYNEPTEVEP